MSAEIDLVEAPKARALVVLGYPSVFEAVDEVQASAERLDQ